MGWLSDCLIFFNPLICIPSATSTVLVGLIDIILGGGTLFLSWFAIYNFKDARALFESIDMNEDVAWFGVISIPIFAFIGVYNGFKQLVCLCRKKRESPHVWKFMVFLISEVLGFVLPFYVFQDYEEKVEYLIKNPLMDFQSFKLLQVNWITISIFAYEIFSFLIVHRHNIIMENRHKSIKSQEGKVSVHSGGNGDFVVDMNIGNQQSLPRPNYQKLDEILDEINKLPGYGTAMRSPRRCLPPVEMSSSDSESSSSEPSPSFTSNKGNKREVAGRRKELTSFEMKKIAYANKQKLFEDREFPATNKSLGSGRSVQWKRPHEISPSARFSTEGFTRFDVQQGSLGDCWFLAALSNLTLYPDLFENVVPFDNEWGNRGSIYAGMCHFWFYNKVKNAWKEITIDDRLPTRNGKLIYLSSSDPDEFWPALIEKAFAKMFGSYAALDTNDIGVAMEFLTGGLVTTYQLADREKTLGELFSIMEQALNKGGIVGLASNAEDEQGIIGGHAYSVTKVSRIPIKSGRQEMAIRIRNPWGNESEWTGTFSDRHLIWNQVDTKVKNALQVRVQNDGEFWFPVSKMAKFFHVVEICYLKT